MASILNIFKQNDGSLTTAKTDSDSKNFLKVAGSLDKEVAENMGIPLRQVNIDGMNKPVWGVFGKFGRLAKWLKKIDSRCHKIGSSLSRSKGRRFRNSTGFKTDSS